MPLVVAVAVTERRPNKRRPLHAAVTSLVAASIAIRFRDKD